jgi:peptide-methionine (R)-S-oxide reductase
MKVRILIIAAWMAVTGFTSCAQQPSGMQVTNTDSMNTNNDKLEKTDDEWKKLLTPVQFDILRLKGTERPFTGEYDTLFDPGTYYCAACGTELFTSKTKYNSGCGWPAFYEPATNKNIIEKRDLSHGMVRTEVTCAKCGGHLGHVFNDGPKPTGLRYCINSGALKFQPKTK